MPPRHLTQPRPRNAAPASATGTGSRTAASPLSPAQLPLPPELLCTVLHRARKPPQILSFACTCFKPAIRLNTADGYVMDDVCPALQHNWDSSLLVDPSLFEINTETSPRRKSAPNHSCPLGRSHR